MKNIIKYIAVFAIVIAFVSCDEESNFEESTIALTPVYTISDITGTNAAFKINIYKEKSVIVEYSSSVNLESYTSSGFTDASTDTTYEVTVNKLDDETTINYVLSADKTTGDGTLTVDGTTIFNVKVSEEEVYN
ncbi:hypothetical protein MPF19_05860 [Polaribacter sp. Z014]|uniref:hypothetical protein n=1 Tax=Polaribacter sp. Z014 TaxID=2927126 RepID=UPI0020223282|nr:hypothetical protein [Polaribacter sp. Z014]MCL7762936.1 hypothetical protein [Polaribacter sp. Z014]